MTLTPNPGFALLIGAALALALPRAARAPAMIAAAIAALYVMFARDFGIGPGFAQIGLTITPLRLDPLAQVFGVGFGLAGVVLTLFASSRRNRFEDVALMAQIGGAMTAVFAGDLVSFVAAAQCAGFAGAALVFAGGQPDSRGAGVRMLCWQALAGILMAAGVGLAWASTGHVAFERLQAQSLEGGFLFAGFAIMAGAPLAHVWLKDSVPQTSALGGAVLAALPLKLGLYALARAFPGEPLLVPLGVAMAVGALPFAALAGDVRRAGAYGVISQSGAALTAIGAGTPLSLAAAAAFAVTSLLSGMLGLLALGVAGERAGAWRGEALGGLARTMPATAGLALVAAASAMAAPGFAGFAGAAILIDAIALEDRPLVWLALVASGAGAALHLGARLPFTVFFGADQGKRPADPPFAALLAMTLAAFFIVAIGFAPGWLYGFLPAETYLRPYDWDHFLRQAQLALGAVLAFAVVRALRLYPTIRDAEVLDTDWLIRRPGRALVAAIGRISLGAYDKGRALAEAVYTTSARTLNIIASEGDRPAAPDSAGMVWALVALAVTMMFLFAFQG